MKSKLLNILILLVMSAGVYADSFKVAVLPDTQLYSQSYPATFNAQTQWVVDNKVSENIAFLTHVGDIVQSNGDDPNQWLAVDTAMDILDGQLPYSACLGNHDTHTMYEKYDGAAEFLYFFGPGRYSGYSWYGGSDRKGWSHYQIFEADGRQWLHLNLEFCPDDETLKWAQDVLDANPTLPAIYSTHAYISDAEEDPNDPTSAPKWSTISNNTIASNGGEAQWKHFIYNNDQIFLVLCGHHSGDDGESLLIAPNAYGNDVIQVCQDYQKYDNGGNGWMRLFELDADNDVINVTTYSPTLNDYMTDETSQFSLSLDFDVRLGSFATRDSMTIPAVQAANINVLQYSTGNEPNEIDVWIPEDQSTSCIVVTDPNDETTPNNNRGDYHLQIGDNIFDDILNGVYIASVAENGRTNGDHYEHAGYEHFHTASIGYGITNWMALHTTSRMYDGETERYSGGHEDNANIAVAYFPFELGWIAAHGSNMDNNGDLFTVLSGGQIVMDDNISESPVLKPRGTGDYEQDGIWELTLDGIDSMRDGVLLACGGKNEDNYSSAGPCPDGSGWSIFTHDNGANGCSTGEQDPFNIVFVPYETPGIAAGLITGYGGIVNGTDNFRVYHESTGVYLLTIAGHTPESGTLLVTGCTGSYADDNIITYEPDGDAWRIEVRDLQNASLQDNKYENPAITFVFIPFDNPPVSPGDNRVFNTAEISAGDFEVTHGEVDCSRGDHIREIYRIGGRNYITASTFNDGDYGFVRSGYQMPLEEGILMATVRQATRDDGSGSFVATLSADRTCMYNKAGITLHKAQSSKAEANCNFAAAWFPFEGGYAGGHINKGDSAEASNGPAVTVESGDSALDGDHLLSLNEIETDDGVLFVTAQCNDDKTACAAPANGTQWKVVLRDNTATFGYEDDEFGYLYLPYSNNDVLLGHVNSAGEIVSSNGYFTVTRISTGMYRVSISGGSVDEGMLLLNGYDVNDSDEPMHTRMSYEADGDDFIITCYELGTSPSLADSAFVFGYVPFSSTWTFNNTSKSTDMVSFAAFAKTWQTTYSDSNYDAQWDYDNSGSIDTNDFVKFASNWLQ